MHVKRIHCCTLDCLATGLTPPHLPPMMRLVWHAIHSRARVSGSLYAKTDVF